MRGAYAYTPYLWPMLASAVFSLALGIYAWRRRGVPGALPFAIMELFAMLWSLGAAFELAAVEDGTKIFWFKFQATLILPTTTAELCFALQYTRLGRLLTRRNLALLSILPVINIILILTHEVHHELWLGFTIAGNVHPKCYWLVLNPGDVSVCIKHPGFDIDVVVSADLAAFYEVWMGRITFTQAMQDQRLELDAAPSLVRAFPKWFALSQVARVVRAVANSGSSQKSPFH